MTDVTNGGEDDLGELPAPLKVKCTDTKCDDDLHCFKATKKMIDNKRAGSCRVCGADLVDWDRVHARHPGDVSHTFTELRREYIRHHFWHIEIDEKAQKHARRKGRAGLMVAAAKRLRTSVGKAGGAWDGRQTPFSGNAIFYAQHATASCCRKCIEYWHAIPADRDLTESEVAYLHGLVAAYLEERLPGLPDEPERID